MITFNSLDALWINALDILQRGDLVQPRGMAVKELRGTTFILDDPARNILVHPDRKLNYAFGVAEWLWMMFGRRDVATIAAYNKNIAQFSDDGIVFFGAYGPKIKEQIAHILMLLTRDVHSRQAVMTTWREEALTGGPTKDVPCTLTWQFFIRHGYLELHVNMRSNDVWLGMPYDIFNFTQIQRMVANQLQVKVGRYVHHVGSLHLYEQHFKASEVILADVKRDQWMQGISPPPGHTLPPQMERILTGLAESMLSIEEARTIARSLDWSWQAYAGVLIHRFSKDLTDLHPPYDRFLA